MATKRKTKRTTKKSVAGMAAKTGSRKQSGAKKSSKRTTRSKKRVARKRELLEPTPGDKRFVRRDAQGRFDEVEDVGRSLAQDRRRKAKKRARRGQGDRGDR